MRGAYGGPLSTSEPLSLSNVSSISYNAAMSSHVMTVSRNGQVSIPADTRARWHARKVVVVDLGDYLVMRPLSEDPISELRGKYRDRGPSADVARRRARADEARRG
jgi:hypothetical protein